MRSGPGSHEMFIISRLCSVVNKSRGSVESFGWDELWAKLS
jgi:hypothetical protein